MLPSEVGAGDKEQLKRQDQVLIEKTRLALLKSLAVKLPGALRMTIVFGES